MAKYLDLTGLKYFITKRIGKTDISKIGDGTCTGAISALNQSLGNLKTDLNKLNSLGNISIMKMSTKILEILPGNNSCLLLSKNDVISALGLSSSTFNFDNLCVSITNGDGAAFSGHLESPTITTTGIYVVWKDKVTASCNIHIKIIYVFLTIFLYLLKCPQSLILSALRAFCFCGKPHISRSIFLYFRYQAWLKSW